ncbi:MAG: hypothetical protein SCM11_02050 [Bacillota bacterium]|nr:hypothetical protein [Bacillota bacterium]
MNLMDRYVYAVVRHVPASQKADIEKEIRAMIDELLQEKMKKTQTGQDGTASGREGQNEPDEQAVRAVLTSLGDPAELARQYHGSSQYVIGPALYETYWLVMRIVLAATGIGLLIATVIQLVTDSQMNGWEAFGSLTGGLFQGLLSAFGMVTLIFLLINRYGADEISKGIKEEKEKWKPDDLPQVPEAKLRIKRSDPIANVIFSLIFLVIINVYPELFGYYQKTGDELMIIGFLGEGFFSALIWINLVIVLGIILEALKIVTGRWTLPLTLSCMVQNSFSLIVSLRVVRDPAFINPEFIKTINTFLSDSGTELSFTWQNALVTGITVLIVFGFIVEMITLIAKSVRLLQTK